MRSDIDLFEIRQLSLLLKLALSPDVVSLRLEFNSVDGCIETPIYHGYRTIMSNTHALNIKMHY